MSGQQALELACAHGAKLRLNAAGDGLLLETDGDPPADLVEMLQVAKPELVERLRKRRRLEAVEATRPPDVSDAHWRSALRGLAAFVASGHGEKAEALGWTRDELYAVPKLWSQIHLTGVALLIAGNEVIAVTATEIRIKTASGSSLAFYRKPEVDYALVFRERLKQVGLDAGKEEFQLRAIEHTVAEYRKHHSVDLEAAKAAVLAAITAKAKQT
jgi:hypothetical protein